MPVPGDVLGVPRIDCCGEDGCCCGGDDSTLVLDRDDDGVVHLVVVTVVLLLVDCCVLQSGTVRIVRRVVSRLMAKKLKCLIYVD